MQTHDRQQHADRTLADPRWATIASRDRMADGRFYYSVKTTGVYCRPSCAARLPRPENVRFHATPADAEQAGFRPCKRCKPDRTDRDAKQAPIAQANDTIRFAVGECVLGSMLVASSRDGLCAILMGEDPEALVQDAQRRFPRERLIRDDNGLEREIAQVSALIQAPSRGFELSLDLRGSDFQQRVWRTLRDIPAGSTASYAEIARRIGSPDAVRAVAGACAANPLAVAIPCHRVVRSDGGLSGYRWGIERKRDLLERETQA